MRLGEVELVGLVEIKVIQAYQQNCMRVLREGWGLVLYIPSLTPFPKPQSFPNIAHSPFLFLKVSVSELRLSLLVKC
jgi:hypothetical protein